ncbi:MAG TPA: hypothetical protein VFX16_07115 [Pseudonocardiaceae bacterium]|nr:hypothetical protein [Pseudonocardiaceae bacterium]
MLAQRIRERRLTFEEFSEQLEVFARENNEVGTMSTRHAQRIAARTLTVEQLRPATVRLLEKFFESSIDELLAPPAGVPSPILATSVRGMTRAAASDARRISAWMESTSTSSGAVQIYRDALIVASGDFLNRPIAEVFDDLTGLRREMFGDIEAHRHHPRHVRELLTLVGMASVVMAHASHLLGYPDVGMTQARLAQLCAADADHVELGAWACGTQALLAEGTGRLRDALTHVRTACERLARSRTPGTAAVRLASYEARIVARLSSDTKVVRAALTASERAREALRGSSDVADLDDIGGILQFPEPKAEMYAGQVFSLIGHPAMAESHARAAIDSYLSGEPEQRSYGDIALARIDIAVARLAVHDLDGVEDALTDVFALPVVLRTEHLRPPLAALATALEAPPYRTVVVANDIRESIRAFATTPRRELDST